MNKIKMLLSNAYNSILSILKVRKYQVSLSICFIASIISLFGILKISALAITFYLLYEIAANNPNK